MMTLLGLQGRRFLELGSDDDDDASCMMIMEADRGGLV